MLNAGFKKSMPKLSTPGMPSPGISRNQASAIAYAYKNRQGGMPGTGGLPGQGGTPQSPGQMNPQSPLFAALMGPEKKGL